MNSFLSGTGEFFNDVGRHVCDVGHGTMYSMSKMGSMMNADFNYEHFNDRSDFHAHSRNALDGYKNFGSALKNNMGATLGKMFIPGIMEAYHNPTSPQAWGKAGVDVALLAAPAILKAMKGASSIANAGRIGKIVIFIGLSDQ